VTDAWQSIKLREFEYVVTGPETCLLRVSGRASWRRGSERRPILLLAHGESEHRFEPLRAPSDRGGSLRAAYAVPSSLVTPSSHFWLERQNGARTELPTPEEGVARTKRLSGPPPVVTEVPEPVATAPVAPELVAPEPVTPEAFEPMALDAPDPVITRELAAASEIELLHARELVSRLEARVAELERTQASDLLASNEAGAVSQKRADAAEKQAEAARDEALRAVATAESLEQRNAEAEQTAQSLMAKVASLEQELANVAPARELLEREVEETRSRRVSLERELDQARDQLRLMTSERDELSRQAAAFDAIAVKARDRATRAEADYENTHATLQELETWRGELERRLAETTSELGAARAAREADERELHRLRSAMADNEVGLRAGNGADAADDTAQTVAVQAEEIERLAAELAILRARTARSSGGDPGHPGG
jgi:predicted  nucleic acid-binding Zn-ribbon protein